MKRFKLNKDFTIEGGKREGKPCIRGLRITVYDVLGWLESGMTTEQILNDYPEINKRDIIACTEFAENLRGKTSVIKSKKNNTIVISYICLYWNHCKLKLIEKQLKNVLKIFNHFINHSV